MKVKWKENDERIDEKSKLPDVVEVGLVNSASYDDNTKYFIAGSFKDGTRVADINPELWSDLFLSNRENVVIEIEKYKQQLDKWCKALKENDAEALKDMMKEASVKRRELY